jgi:hypothetical protein
MKSWEIDEQSLERRTGSDLEVGKVSSPVSTESTHWHTGHQDSTEAARGLQVNKVKVAEVEIKD